MPRVFGVAHVENAVLYTCGLRCGPMKTVRLYGCRNVCHIKDDITDLSEEDVRRSPSSASFKVWIAVDDAHAGDVGSRLEYRHVIGIADDLSVVIIND